MLFIINYFLISWQFHFCETFVSYKAFRVFRASRYCLCFFLTPALCMLNYFIISSSSNFICSTTTEEQAGDDAAITICFLPCHLSLEHLFHTNTLTGSLAFWLNQGKHRIKIDCWLARTIISLFKRFLENILQVKPQNISNYDDMFYSWYAILHIARFPNWAALLRIVSCFKREFPWCINYTHYIIYNFLSLAARVLRDQKWM